MVVKELNDVILLLRSYIVSLLTISLRKTMKSIFIDPGHFLCKNQLSLNPVCNKNHGSYFFANKTKQYLANLIKNAKN